MLRNLLLALSFAVLNGVIVTSGYSATINVGYASFDVTNDPLAEIDLINLSGGNGSAPDFPIATAVNLSSLTMVVDFTSGSSETFGPSSKYFTPSLDGLSFDGGNIFNSATNPVGSVTVSGTFSPTEIDTGGGFTIPIDSTFTATITDSKGVLADGDLGLIVATTGVTPNVPEPGTYLLVALGFGLLFVFRGRKQNRLAIMRRWAPAALCLCFAAVSSWAATPIQLSAATAPSSGVSGTSTVGVTGTGLPTGTFNAVTVSLASSCDAAGTTTVATSEVKVFGTTYKINFLVPASLKTGLYYVSVSGSMSGGAFSSGTSCAKVQVTKTSPVLASCNPGSSMSILSYNPSHAAKTPIVAYVPNGYWEGGADGVQVVPVEGGGSTATVATTHPVNSCSSNSLTGQTVCIDNYTGVYIVEGSKLSSTLVSSANAYASFSGGSCENCTVAVNEAAGTKGQAVIGIGYSGAAGESALQFLDLATNTFGAPVPMANRTSEDILWDPFLNAVLSPNEDGVYEMYKVTGGGIPGPAKVSEFANAVRGTFDSAAEDCTTQIALSSLESYPAGLYLTDLKQATTTPGTPGTFTAPGQTVAIPEFSQFSAATDGIAVAPGSTHLGLITGEFGGDQFGVLSLPATSGHGTPALVDYVAAVLPATPDGCQFSAGYDPHTTTAYTSPNDGKAYGVLADWDPGVPSYLAVVDLEALLKAPRKAGIYPDGSACSTCVKTVDPSYNLLAKGIVRYIGTGNRNCTGSATAAFRAERPVNTMGKPK